MLATLLPFVPSHSLAYTVSPWFSPVTVVPLVQLPSTEFTWYWIVYCVFVFNVIVAALFVHVVWPSCSIAPVSSVDVIFLVVIVFVKLVLFYADRQCIY